MDEGFVDKRGSPFTILYKEKLRKREIKNKRARRVLSLMTAAKSRTFNLPAHWAYLAVVIHSMQSFVLKVLDPSNLGTFYILQCV